MRLNRKTAQVLATELIGIISEKKLLELDGLPISISEFNIIPNKILEAIPLCEKENIYKITVNKKITIFFVHIEPTKQNSCWIVRQN